MKFKIARSREYAGNSKRSDMSPAPRRHTPQDQEGESRRKFLLVLILTNGKLLYLAGRHAGERAVKVRDEQQRRA